MDFTHRFIDFKFFCFFFVLLINIIIEWNYTFIYKIVYFIIYKSKQMQFCGKF